MGLSLASAVSFCILDDQYIFLDLKTDCYRTLSTECAEAFRAADHPRLLTPQQLSKLDGLVTEGILTLAGSGEAPRPCRVPILARSVLPVETVKNPSILKMGGPMLALAGAALALPFASLASVIGQIRRTRDWRPSPAEQAPRERLETIAAAFSACDVLLGSHDKCLRRSVAMAKYLIDRNFNPTLVLGVQAIPFAAHSWVQVGNLLLNDELDHVRTIMPILVL